MRHLRAFSRFHPGAGEVESVPVFVLVLYTSRKALEVPVFEPCMVGTTLAARKGRTC
jgi:hypothetical protein